MNSPINKQNLWLKKLTKEINKRIVLPNFATEDLVQPMMTSRTQLYRKIKVATGLTPNQFIQQLRLVKAQKLILSNKYDSIHQIANEVGFKRLDEFQKLYQNTYGDNLIAVFEQLWGQRLKSLILKKLAYSNYSVEDLVFDMRIDRKLLYERTKRVTGTSPGRYIRQLKLEKAKALIESGNVNSIKEVAENVGFQRVDYFSKLYKELYDYHPKEYLEK